VLSPDQPEVALVPGEAGTAGTGSTFWRYISEGIWHIWIGLDHILFLLSLLLLAPLQRQRGWLLHWPARDALRSSLMDVVAVVTAFTVAHSITLALALTRVVEPPRAIVDSHMNVARHRLTTITLAAGLAAALGAATLTHAQPASPATPSAPATAVTAPYAPAAALPLALTRWPGVFLHLVLPERPGQHCPLRHAVVSPGQHPVPLAGGPKPGAAPGPATCVDPRAPGGAHAGSGAGGSAVCPGGLQHGAFGRVAVSAECAGSGGSVGGVCRNPGRQPVGAGVSGG